MPIPFDWVFSLFHKFIEEDVPGLDEVISGLKLVNSLISTRSAYYGGIPIEVRALHFLHLFMFSAEFFLDTQFQAQATIFFDALGCEATKIDANEPRIDFETILGGNLTNFIQSVTEIFVHQSFGNRLFSQVRFLLHKNNFS